MMHPVLCLYLGCSTSICQFWHWGFGTWVKWCSEAVEMGTERTKNPSGKVIASLKHVHIVFFSLIICVSAWDFSFLGEISEVCVCLKATANVVPQHWQPNSGLLMANDVSGVNLEESVRFHYLIWWHSR